MEKIITIDDCQVRLYVLQVFDEKQGHINEHILAVDITNIYYENESILKIADLIKKDFPDLKALYYRMSADNYNTIYISLIGKSAEKHAVPGVNASSEDCIKYALTMENLKAKY